jgi:hypothetical protein
VDHLNMGAVAVVGLLVIKTQLAPEAEAFLGLLAVGRVEVLTLQILRVTVVTAAA